PTHSRSHTHTHTHTHTQTGLYPCCLLLSLCFKCALLRLGAGYAAGELRDLNDLSFCSPSVILLAGSHSTAPCCSPAIPFHVGHTVHEAFTYNPTHLASTISPTSFCAIQSDGTDFAPSHSAYLCTDLSACFLDLRFLPEPCLYLTLC